MNQLGIFLNFWEQSWAADHAKYIRKAAAIGYDVLEFQAQALLDMEEARLLELKNLAGEQGVELTYSLGWTRRMISPRRIRRCGSEEWSTSPPSWTGWP